MKNKLAIKIAASLLIASASAVFAENGISGRLHVEQNSAAKLALLDLMANDSVIKKGAGVLQAVDRQNAVYGTVELQEGVIELTDRLGLGNGKLKMSDGTKLSIMDNISGFQNNLPLEVSFAGNSVIDLNGKNLDMFHPLKSFDVQNDAVLHVKGGARFAPTGSYVAGAKQVQVNQQNVPTDRLILEDENTNLYLNDSNLVPADVVMLNGTMITVQSQTNINLNPIVVNLPNIIIGNRN